MDDGADADLEIILRAGIEMGADVVGFGAEGDAGGSGGGGRFAGGDGDSPES